MTSAEPRFLGPLHAVGAALLFGLSVPAAKTIVGELNPVLLAGLLYLGSGMGLGLLRLLWRNTSGGESLPSRRDIPWLLSASLFGGALAPALLMLGLSGASGAEASLLLNFEGVFTALLAWLVFRENVDLRIGVGMIMIVLVGVTLSWNAPGGSTINSNQILIILACFAWAVDNNLTRKVSHNDPVVIAAIKGLFAGGGNLLLALLLGAEVPSRVILFKAGVIGFLGYGISLALYILALRHIGAARTGAYFSLAPFFGASIALVIWPETIHWSFLFATGFMALGVWLHLTEKHEHLHVHEPMRHTHRHVHDEHHQHEHGPDDPPGEPHVHEHEHPRMEHSHPHYPDIHHQHEH
jgi:drug/metabolite transporter (DMT)-like permease